MKLFIYKTLIVAVTAFLLFQFTIGQKISSYESKIENILHNKQKREEILNKIKEEIRSANQKEKLFTEEERDLLSNFIKKIQNELDEAN